MSREIYARVGEAGFVVEMASDYKPASIDSATLHFTKPDGTVVSKTCDTVDTAAGTYGWLVDDAAFFDVPGNWMVSLEIAVDASGNNVRKSRRPRVLLIGASTEA